MGGYLSAPDRYVDSSASITDIKRKIYRSFFELNVLR